MYAKQGVVLCGFGSRYFQRAMDALGTIQDQIAKAMDTEVVPLSIATHHSWPVLEASNRYFTQQSKAPHAVLSSFPDDVDPQGILLKRAKTSNVQVVHLDDNEVGYFRLKDDIEDGEK